MSRGIVGSPAARSRPSPHRCTSRSSTCAPARASTPSGKEPARDLRTYDRAWSRGRVRSASSGPGRSTGCVTTLLGLDLTGRARARRRRRTGGGAPRRSAARRRRARHGRRSRSSARTCVDLVRPASVDVARREVRGADLDGAWLVHAATGDPRVDAARLRLGAATAGSGASTPAPPTRRLRPHPGRRPGMPATSSSASSRTGDADPARAARCATRSPSTLRDGTVDLRRRRRAGGAAGRVVLVGGGPGCRRPDDRRAAGGRSPRPTSSSPTGSGPTRVLDELAADVEVIDVGKTPGHHPVPQDEINAILVDQAAARARRRAAQGRRPVRLRPRRRGGAVACRPPACRSRWCPASPQRCRGARSRGHPGDAPRHGRPPSTSINGHDGLDQAALRGLRDGDRDRSSCSWASAALGDHVDAAARRRRDPDDCRSRSSRTATLPRQRVTRAPLDASSTSRPPRGARPGRHRRAVARRAPTRQGPARHGGHAVTRRSP